jgi:hypothetical protein
MLRIGFIQDEVLDEVLDEVPDASARLGMQFGHGVLRTPAISDF